MADYTLSVKITAVSSSFEKAFSSAEKAASNFAKKMSSIGKSISSVGDALTSKITKPALAATSALTGITLVKGYNRLVGIDDARAKLTALGHDATSVEEIMNSALASVKGTSYGLEEAATTAANAVAAGIAPGQELTNYLTMTSDAAALAGVSMSEMGSILNRVQTGQTAFTEDLEQLADRGLPVYQWLAEEAGVAASEVKGLASDGKISSEMFFAAIEKNVGGAAKIIGETSLTGVLSNIGASVARIGANFLGATDDAGSFMGQVLPLLNEFKDYLGGVEETAKKVGAVFGEVFGALVTYVRTGQVDLESLSDTAGGIVERITPVIDVVRNIADAFSSLSPTMQAALTGGVVAAGPLIAILGKVTTGFGGVMSVASSMGGVVSKGFDDIGGAAAKVASTIGGRLLDAFTGLPVSSSRAFSNTTRIASSFMSGMGKVLSFGGIVGIALAGLGLLQTGFGDQLGSMLTMAQEKGPQLITDFCSGIVSGLPQLIAAGGQLLSQFLSTITANLPAIVNGGAQILSALVLGIAQQLPTLIPKAMELIVTFVQALITNLPMVLDAGLQMINALAEGVLAGVAQVFQPVIDWAAQAWEAIKVSAGELADWFTDKWNSIRDFFSETWQKIQDIASAALQGIQDIWSGITGFFSGRWNDIRNTATMAFNGIKSFLDGVYSGIRSVWSGLTGFFAGLWNGIKNTTSSVFDGIYNTITRVFQGVQNAWSGLTGFTSGVFSGISSGFESLVNSVKGVVNGVIRGINGAIGIINKIPGVNIGSISYLAHGTDDWPGGFAVMNEGGRGELTYLPNGSQVIPHDISVKYAKEAARINTTAAAAERPAPVERTVNQTVNIYQPVKSPVETYRAVKRAGKELAYAGG